MKVELRDKEWTCEVCGELSAPIFIRTQTDGNNHRYCADHDPISREEFEKIWGITPDMKQPRSKRGRPRKED